MTLDGGRWALALANASSATAPASHAATAIAGEANCLAESCPVQQWRSGEVSTQTPRFLGCSQALNVAPSGFRSLITLGLLADVPEKRAYNAAMV